MSDSDDILDFKEWYSEQLHNFRIELDRLQRETIVHNAITQRHEEDLDRLEGVYLKMDALRTAGDELAASIRLLLDSVDPFEHQSEIQSMVQARAKKAIDRWREANA